MHGLETLGGHDGAMNTHGDEILSMTSDIRCVYLFTIHALRV